MKRSHGAGRSMTTRTRRNPHKEDRGLTEIAEENSEDTKSRRNERKGAGRKAGKEWKVRYHGRRPDDTPPAKGTLPGTSTKKTSTHREGRSRRPGDGTMTRPPGNERGNTMMRAPSRLPTLKEVTPHGKGRKAYRQAYYWRASRNDPAP